MLIATHPTHPGCAYVLEDKELYFLYNTDTHTHIVPCFVPHTQPTSPAKMSALFSLVANTPTLPICIDSTLPADHVVPEWLHALRIRNLNPTDPSNTEHLIHTTTPCYLAYIDPDYQEITHITPIDHVPHRLQAINEANKFLASLNAHT